MIILGERLTWMWLVVLALATFRIVRFVVADDYPLWAPLRARITRRWPPEPGAWSEVLVCPWCSSPYIAAGVLVVWLYVPYWTAPVAVILAFSAVAGLLAEWGGG